MQAEQIKPAVGRAFTVEIMIVLAVLLCVPILVVAGPHLEARFFPVLVDHKPDYRIEDGMVVATHDLRKVRDCRAISRTIELNDQGGTETLDFQSPVARVMRGDRAKKLVSRAPLTAKIEPPFTIDGMIYYRCHRLWLTPYRYPSWSSLSGSVELPG